MGELCISGIAKFRELDAPAFAPSREGGLTLACSHAYLPAFSGIAPFPSKVVPGFFLLFPPLWFGLRDAFFSIRLRHRGVGRECCPVAPLGVYVFLFALPTSAPPALVGSRFLFRRHAFAHCGRLIRLRAVSVASSAPSSSSVLMRGTLSCST